MAYVMMVEVSWVQHTPSVAKAGACVSEQNPSVFPGDLCSMGSSMTLGKSLDVRWTDNFSSKWVSCCGLPWLSEWLASP